MKMGMLKKELNSHKNIAEYNFLIKIFSSLRMKPITVRF